ncbi:MAG TPA: NAD(P)-binding domain-containing protein [Woeseiaceae bacterium]|jgi:predicted dinucleotide-binding enzyme|nr:NAD(P)-binding domain-containing protein [Woeseiaceae bacterium]
MRWRSLFVVLLTLSAATGPAALAETIAIIGTGNVGMALGTEFAARGNTIVYGSRNPDSEKTRALVEKTGAGASAALPGEAASGADIVVLAVPGMVVETVVRGLGELERKIVIDATNPLVMTEARQFEFGVATSNGEIVQAALPGARVIKAFNTIPWQVMIDPGQSARLPLVPLSGDDAEAKARVAELVSALGLRPLDFGPIWYSRWTELTATIMLNQRLAGRDDYQLILRPN